MDGTRKVVLSVDYEIFGNGTGDVMQHIVRPTEAMAAICERYRAPLTVFFEAEEYAAFVRYEKELTALLGYNPAETIRSQLVSLLKRGHDVQLHLHPEWYGATLANGRWQLNMEKRAVDDLFETQEEVTSYIAERKALVDEIIAEVHPEREVTVYRAGAFTAQPGGKLLLALEKNGILIDSSVVKGLKGVRPGGLDYRNAPCAKGPWRVKDNVAVENSEGGVWEFPVYAEMGRRFHQLTFGRLKAKFSRNVPKERQKQMMNDFGINRKNPVRLINFLLQPTPIKLDFHNLSAGKFLQFAKAAPASKRDAPDVVVSIGHTKEHVDDAWFERIVRGVAQDPKLRIVSFDEVAQGVCAGTASG
jgi:hypothetical protein